MIPYCSLVVFCIWFSLILSVSVHGLELSSGGTGLIPAQSANKILDGIHRTAMTAPSVVQLPVGLYSTTELNHW